MHVIEYLGMALLISGTLWNGDIMGKLREVREKYRELQRQN